MLFTLNKFSSQLQSICSKEQNKNNKKKTKKNDLLFHISYTINIMQVHDIILHLFPCTIQ